MASLRRALAELEGNERQWEAFNVPGHCAVLAPPGSGKTKLLTTKMASDLSTERIPPPQGAACITMTNEAALQLRWKLRDLGAQRRPNLFVGTVHAFAAARIVGPLAAAAGRPQLAELRIATKQERESIFLEQFVEAGFRPFEQDEIWTTMNKARRQLDLSGNPRLGGEPVAGVAGAYQEALARRGLCDFDDLIRYAVELVSECDWLAATFPRIYVDEYQDLAPGLDRLVREICLEAEEGSVLFAVGDPDQAIFGFTGTRPELLQGLAGDARVTRVVLERNYRCGQAIVDLSLRALGEARQIRGGHDGGSVTVHVAPGGVDAQTAKAVEVVAAARERGVEDDRIVVVAPWKSDRDSVVDGLRAERVPVYSRSEEDWRPTAVTMLVEAMASWAARGDESGLRLDELLETLRALIRAEVDHEVMTAVVRVLIDSDSESAAGEFVAGLTAAAFQDLADDPGASEDAQELARMREALAPSGGLGELTVGELGDRARAVGRVMAATIHGAKGLEFEVVVLVGADDSALVGFSPSEDELREGRRKFYVSMTRAKDEVHVIHTDRRVSRRGSTYQVEPSRFIAELAL